MARDDAENIGHPSVDRASLDDASADVMDLYLDHDLTWDEAQAQMQALWARHVSRWLGV